MTPPISTSHIINMMRTGTALGHEYSTPFWGGSKVVSSFLPLPLIPSLKFGDAPFCANPCLAKLLADSPPPPPPHVGRQLHLSRVVPRLAHSWLAFWVASCGRINDSTFSWVLCEDLGRTPTGSTHTQRHDSSPEASWFAPPTHTPSSRELSDHSYGNIR